MDLTIQWLTDIVMHFGCILLDLKSVLYDELCSYILHGIRPKC